MPRYHFNFYDGRGAAADVDEIGCDFDNLDLAYLDAYRSMVRIGAEMLLEQKNPSMMRIEIVDGSGRMLLTLPFDEVFAQRVKPAPTRTSREELRRRFETSRRLTAEIRGACAMARTSIAVARVTMKRADLKARQCADRGL